MTGPLASSPCAAPEPGPDPADGAAVARWRDAQRTRLRAARLAWPVAARAAVERALSDHLRAVLAARRGDARVLSGYWPIKGEPDLRPLMAEWHAQGLVIALPVVERRRAPLVFRRWTPGMALVRGDWNIPVPPPDAPRLVPDIALAPLVGWDGCGYRLGYGGGYFDRTLAALDPRPLTIGVGVQAGRLASIHPQPHDIGLDMIVTEAGLQVDRAAGQG